MKILGNQYIYHSLFNITVFLLFMALPTSANAQTEWKFADFPNYLVNPVAEMYDGGLLLTVTNRTHPQEPGYLLKVTLDGAILWQKQLKNTLEVFDATATRDSGFAISCNVNLYPGAPLDLNSLDSIQKAAILKFDKCGNLEWGRYIYSNTQSYSMDIVEGNDGNIFLQVMAINGNNPDSIKIISILNFAEKGGMTKVIHLGGITATIMYDTTEENLILTRNAYLPLSKTDSSGIVYLFPCLSILNNDLHALSKNVIGYKDFILGGAGPTILRNKEVIHLSLANKDGKSMMFTTMDNYLQVIKDPVFEKDNTYWLAPVFGFSTGDSIIIAAAFRPYSINFISSTSLRLYDHNFNLIKETQINEDYTQSIRGLLPLKGSRTFVAGIEDTRNTPTDIGYGLLYLLDHQLNFKTWTIQPGPKGYDWACSTSIPYLDTINVNEVVEPVYVPIDSTLPDWSWIFSLGIDEQENNTRIEGSWIIYPQPCAKNGLLHIRSDLNKSPGVRITQIRFYDLSGRQVAITEAVSNNESQWTVQTSNLSHSGIYIAELLNGGRLIGRVKVVVQ